MTNKSKSLMAVFLSISAATFPAFASRTVYVDRDAAGANDGSCWPDAYNHLQDALTDANASAKPVEICVAQGTYKPDEDSLHPDGSGDREATFQLISGMAIYGGYAGYGEPEPNERDVEAYETILSGDLNGDDVGFTNNGDNSYHIVTGGGTDPSTTIDGFTITAGNANCSYPYNSGGGMYNGSGNPTVTNCIFTGNNCRGMYNNNSSSPIVTNCMFTMNNNGGMYNNNSSSPIVTNCMFTVNNGGGMYNNNSSSPRVIDCTFSGNTAGVGGGMFNRSYSSPILYGCTFSGNLVSRHGGGMCNSYDSCNSIVTNCTFIGNSAVNGGGAMQNYHSSPTVTNCIFIANSTDNDGGAMWNGHGVVSMITNCVFSGNRAGGKGGGILCWYKTSPTLSNCILWGNIAGEGPQITLDGGHLYVSYCNVQGGEWDVFLDNEEDDSILYWLEGNIDSDPYFADADNDDYHLKSQAGRWDPNSESWVTDDVNSPCVDTGDPNSDWTAELWPHGKRINMGAFGGTPQASMSESSLGNRADLDNNRSVNFGDLARLVNWWRAEGPLRAEDLNRDETVNFFDILQFAQEWLWHGI